MIFASLSFSLEATQPSKDFRLLIRKPLGEAIANDHSYDGWKIEGDVFFYNMMVKHLKFIEKNCPDFYSKGKRDVKVIRHSAATGSYAYPAGKVFWIGDNDINFRMFGDDWVIATIVHEFQHCNPFNNTEEAACWSATVYGPKLKLHPSMVTYLRAMALRGGYSQEKWNKLEK